MSEKTTRPLSAQGSVKSSSVPISTPPRRTPLARVEPSTGRSELCMKSVWGWFTPPTPPPATSTGFHGRAQRRLSV